jgi:hypothetical protein
MVPAIDLALSWTVKADAQCIAKIIVAKNEEIGRDPVGVGFPALDNLLSTVQHLTSDASPWNFRTTFAWDNDVRNPCSIGSHEKGL